jgi:hypothetical protein
MYCQIELKIPACSLHIRILQTIDYFFTGCLTYRDIFAHKVMEKNIEYAQTEFNNNAAKFFFSLYARFHDAVILINRRKDENVFQQLRGKYLYTLRNQLEDMAKACIDKYKSSLDVNQLKETLSYSVNRYANEFIQKAGSL